MSKHVSSGLATVILTLALAALAVAQTTTTTTSTKTTIQNPDGTYTIIEYPAKKEVTLTLNPVTIQGANGIATILRDDDGTRIKLNLTNVPADLSALTLYAVDDMGKVTALGPVAVSNGVGTLATTTPLTRFMLVASPESSLTAYDANTKIFFRSAVPEGFAVIPLTSAAGERVAAVTTPGTTVTPATTPTTTIPATTPATTDTTTPATAEGATVRTTYNAPMLNIPSYDKGDETKIKVDFAGAMTGARANVFIKPRKDGPTEVKMRFHELKDAPSGQKYVLWAVSADGKFVKLGQIVNTPGRNEAEIKSETTLRDFGLVVTMEGADGESPIGPAVGTIHIVP